MIEMSYWSFILMGIMWAMIGAGIAWRRERNRYEHLIDIFREENNALKNALRDEILKNETLERQTKNEKLKNDLLKKRINKK